MIRIIQGNCRDGMAKLNPDYIKIATKRIEGETGLFADVRVD